MRRDPRNIGEHREASNSNSLASVVRSFSELNSSLQGIAEQMTEASKKSVGRAIEIQAQLAKNTYETYLSEVSKLGRMFLSGYGTLAARAETFPSVGLTRASARVQRTAAHRVATKRRTGRLTRQSGSKRPPKTKK